MEWCGRTFASVPFFPRQGIYLWYTSTNKPLDGEVHSYVFYRRNLPDDRASLYHGAHHYRHPEAPHLTTAEFLTPTEAHTLKMIALNEGISQTELSEQMYRTAGATSVMVDKLVEKGLVHRQRVDGDQRRYLLTLTDRGRLVHASHIDGTPPTPAGPPSTWVLRRRSLKPPTRPSPRSSPLLSGYLSHGALATQPEY